jgi:antitoxin ParD1/3/4
MPLKKVGKSRTFYYDLLHPFERSVMMAKISVSLTDEHVRMVNEAVASGDYASSSEVIRDALRDWKARRLLGRLWDEGVASGRADASETMADIKAEARRRHTRS